MRLRGFEVISWRNQAFTLTIQTDLICGAGGGGDLEWSHVELNFTSAQR
jgi:hypothetical protein